MQSCLTHLPPGQNVRHFENINDNFGILIKISMNLNRKVPIDNISALVYILAWRRVLEGTHNLICACLIVSMISAEKQKLCGMFLSRLISFHLTRFDVQQKYGGAWGEGDITRTALHIYHVSLIWLGLSLLKFGCRSSNSKKFSLGLIQCIKILSLYDVVHVTAVI